MVLKLGGECRIFKKAEEFHVKFETEVGKVFHSFLKNLKKNPDLKYRKIPIISPKQDPGLIFGQRAFSPNFS